MSIKLVNYDFEDDEGSGDDNVEPGTSSDTNIKEHQSENTTEIPTKTAASGFPEIKPSESLAISVCSAPDVVPIVSATVLMLVFS